MRRAGPNRIYRAAENQARHFLALVHPWEKNPSLLLLTKSGSGGHHIRPNFKGEM